MAHGLRHLRLVAKSARGELTSLEQAELHHVLGECDRCRALKSELDRLDRVLSDPTLKQEMPFGKASNDADDFDPALIARWRDIGLRTFRELDARQAHLGGSASLADTTAGVPDDRRRAAGRQIRQRREAMSIGQAELAGRVGITESFLNRIEIGDVTALPAVIRRIANVLGVSADSLGGDVESDEALVKRIWEENDLDSKVAAAAQLGTEDRKAILKRMGLWPR